MSLKHNRDIKLVLNHKGYELHRTLYGFDTYIKEDAGPNVRPVKRIIPDLPVCFGPEQSEDGFQFAWVSDTANNRKRIKQLVTVTEKSPRKGQPGAKPEFSLDDDELLAKWFPSEELEAPAKPAEVAVKGPLNFVESTAAYTFKDLDKLPKPELIAIAEKMGVQADGSKATIIERILNPKD